MTLTNNYAHAIMKEKKTKTDYLRGLSVFVFIVTKLGPFEKPFHKLGLRVSSGFPNPGFQHSKTIKALGLRPRAFSNFLVFGNPDETLALVYYTMPGLGETLILLLKQYHRIY